MIYFDGTVIHVHLAIQQFSGISRGMKSIIFVVCLLYSMSNLFD